VTSEGRLYPPLLVSLGAALAAAAFALGVLTLAAVLGPFRLLSPFAAGPSSMLGVWLPEPATAGPVARRVRAWRAVGGERELSEARSLADLAREDVRVVVLPDARSLSREQADALLAFVRAGGSTLLTGSVGVRAPDGAWLGYDLMQELLDVGRVVPRAAEATGLLSAASRGPLSAPLAPGASIRLVPEPGQPGIDAADAELAWAGGDETSGASRRRSVGRGRIAWLAAGPESSSGDPGLDRVVQAALAWCAREPFVEVLPGTDVAADAAAWQRLHRRLVATAERAGPQRSVVEVANRSREPVSGAALRVHLNDGFVRVAVERTTLQQAPIRAHVDRARGLVDVRLPELGAGERFAFTLDVERNPEPEEQGAAVEDRS
jgi:hypothetical protein